MIVLLLLSLVFTAHGELDELNKKYEEVCHKVLHSQVKCLHGKYPHVLKA